MGILRQISGFFSFLKSKGINILEDYNDLIREYCENWIGFGNPKSSLWFIGLEPGGGDDKNEFKKLLIAWNNLGKENFIDIVDFHKMITSSKCRSKDNKEGNLGEFFFGKNPRIQSTWSKLIYIQLSILRENTDKEDVRKFQKCNWGRCDSDNCIAELLPLPSPKISKWNYSEWFPNMQFLKTRQSYKKIMIEKRIPKVQKLISQCKPKLVVFYGKMDEETEKKFNINLINRETGNGFQYSVCKKDNTIYYCIQHPTSRGITNDYFIGVGNRIRKELKKS